jgi:phage shock protein A
MLFRENPGSNEERRGVMSVLKRIHRLTVSRIENFLSTVEDPEVLFPQLIREMEGQVRTATESEAKALASVKASQRSLDDVQAKLDRMGRGAELAITGGDEATAREAVEAQIKLESALATKTEALERAKETCEQARIAREEIQRQLETLRDKKDEVLTRARVAKNRRKVEKTVMGPVSSSASILDAVAKLESRVEEAEAEIEVKREMGHGVGTPSLEKRLGDLEQMSEVEKRLAALKRKSETTA